MSKSGFSTLNRWLGRKNKEKNSINSKLSKSNTNLSISSSTINENYQLEYNRITPLPIATSNAPFEQTFRITVLLPKDQLYVARLGARVPLSKLLELVCDNKLLDADKYEFRNPVDPSQVYSCDLTIGAMGLSEIRLCHKSESYDTFNADAVIKLHRTSIMRDSLTSSEFSSRFSKQTLKTTSPYSSTNSLNSMDSSGLNYTRSPLTIANGGGGMPKILAPPRKKRTAPLPPTPIIQVSIPEQGVLMDNDSSQRLNGIADVAEKQNTDLPNGSVTNLNSTTVMPPADINGNNFSNEDTALYAQVCKKNALNLDSSNSRPSDDVDNVSLVADKVNLPEPSPRKRIIPIKKKSAPVPPPRNQLCVPEDNLSLSSTSLSLEFNVAATTPLPDVTSKSETIITGAMKSEINPQIAENNENLMTKIQHSETVEEQITLNSMEVPQMVPPTVLNINPIQPQTIKDYEIQREQEQTVTTPPAVVVAVGGGPNISKVLLNRTPTPEPASLCSLQSPDEEPCYDSHMEHIQHSSTFVDNTSEDVYDDDDDTASKQADSGIGETIPSPIPDSLPSADVSSLECKANFESSSSSDDDDLIKVYNFKLGKTLVTSLKETTSTMDELPVLSEETDHTSAPLLSPSLNTDNTSSDVTSPISPPPYFADATLKEQTESDPTSDTPITPKITERPVLNFQILENEEDIKSAGKSETALHTNRELSPNSASTPLDGLVEELSYILQEKGINSLIRKPKTCTSIETVKAANNTLDNFQISTLSKTETIMPNTEQFVQDAKPKSSSPETSNEEKLYRRRSSNTELQQRHSITRADSFHSTVINSNNVGKDALDSRGSNSTEYITGCLGSNRSCSQLSLNHLDQNGNNFNGRRSSSELSIQESPSLQSLEVMKTILNNTNKMKNRKLNDTSSNHQLTPKTSKVETNGEISKDVPKLYRYSGPPSIDVGTWNERPKSQVAIKNEGDYIFGGKSLVEKRQLYKHSSPKHQAITINNSTATLNRMSFPEKDYRLAIKVKQQENLIGANRSGLEQLVKTPNQTIVNVNTTLPRSNMTLYSNQKFIYPVAESPSTCEPLNPTLRRSNEPNKFREAEKPLPFGQIHLRHTGLKEKILARELPECAYQTQNNNRNHMEKQTSEIPTSQSFIPPTSNSNKQRIQFNTSKSMSLVTTNGGGNCYLKSTKSTPQFTTQIQLPKSSSAPLQLKQLDTKLNETNTTITPTPPPPPPIQTPTSPSSKKTNGYSDHQNSAVIDPRDDLMNAIRNFSRTQLRKL